MKSDDMEKKDSKKRIRAHSYIHKLFESVNWHGVDLTKDNELASVLDVNLSDLILLREGKINPSPKLVEKVKCFFKNDPNPTLLAEEIDQALIQPFLC